MISEMIKGKLLSLEFGPNQMFTPHKWGNVMRKLKGSAYPHKIWVLLEVIGWHNLLISFLY